MLENIVIGAVFFLLSILVAMYSGPLSKWRETFERSIADRTLSKIDREKKLASLINTVPAVAAEYHFNILYSVILSLVGMCIGILGNILKEVIDLKTNSTYSTRFSAVSNHSLALVSMCGIVGGGVLFIQTFLFQRRINRYRYLANVEQLQQAVEQFKGAVQQIRDLPSDKE